jgi:MFS superfamily sulfate permease-like transporter
VTPPNRELKAQGVGNIISGLLGGLPVTQVIVRSSANVQSGARSKASTVIHGLLLAVSVIALPTIMNLIPLATLAAILFVVGFKLAKPSVFRKMLRQGPDQFVPFMVTVCGIVFTDLLVSRARGEERRAATRRVHSAGCREERGARSPGSSREKPSA